MSSSSSTSGTMTGKRVLITGCTQGIGKEAALALAALGADLVLIARDRQKLDELAAEIAAQNAPGKIAVEVADLSSQKDIRALAERLLANPAPIDVLINNAGGIFTERRTTVDGIEWTLAVNHLAYFLLTELLLPRMQEHAHDHPVRIINTSSGAHVPGKMNWDDLGYEHGYGGMRVYMQSKLANLLFTFELARKLDGQRITVNALHPGAVRSGFGQNGSRLMNLGIKLVRPFFISPQKGARTIIYLASSPEVEGKSGGYYYKCKPAKSSRRARDPLAWSRLWEVSEKLCGLTAQKLLSAGA